MKSNYFKKLFGGALMAFSLIIGFAASSAVQAQYPQYPYPDDRYRQQDDRYRRDQQDRWRRDRDRNRRDDYDDDRWNQDRWGRRRGWDGYPNWGGGYELRQTALNAGYNAGVREGRNDRNRRRAYDYGYGNTDFGRFSSYRNADKDYNGRFGDRELYRRYFRMAFENGYADGLRGY